MKWEEYVNEQMESDRAEYAQQRWEDICNLRGYDTLTLKLKKVLYEKKQTGIRLNGSHQTT